MINQQDFVRLNHNTLIAKEFSRQNFKKKLRTEYLMIAGLKNTGNQPLKIEQV